MGYGTQRPALVFDCPVFVLSVAQRIEEFEVKEREQWENNNKFAGVLRQRLQKGVRLDALFAGTLTVTHSPAE